MVHRFAEIAFTPSVKSEQERHGSRKGYARFESGDAHHDRLGPQEAGFIAERDSFYMATVSQTGWPYIQHRGGPIGFVRVLDDKTLAFADFSGNRQYISLGNLKNDDRVCLFFMDYANQTRLKLFGRARSIAAEDVKFIDELKLADYRARVERGLIIGVEGYDWNCPQHIASRFTQTQVMAIVSPLQGRIVELEAKLAELTAG